MVKEHSRIRSKLKIYLDFLMIILFIILMGYHIFEDFIHEYLGITLMVLFVIHQILNLNWYKSLFKGKWTYIKIMFVIINSLLMITFVSTMISGILISKNLFVSSIIPSISIVRQIHMIVSSWTYILIAVHTGLHFQVFKNLTNKRHIYPFIKCLYSLLTIFGLYAFFKRDLLSDMFFLVEYKFLPYGESVIQFGIDYMSIYCMFVLIGYMLLIIKKRNN